MDAACSGTSPNDGAREPSGAPVTEPRPFLSMPTNLAILLFALAVLGASFWGYPLGGVNFNTLHFLSKDPFPAFWGLVIVDPATARIDFSFLHRNEGLMTGLLYLLYRMPVSLEDKLVFVNGFNLLVQVVNVGLFAHVVRKLAGANNLFPYLLLYLLYPFAAANHFWGADLPVNLAATLFLLSVSLFLNVEYGPGAMTRNFMLRIGPSLLCLWLSIIMVEYAICLSPLYVYLALYYSNGKTAVLKFRRILTPQTALASVFLLTSLLPAVLFTGHRLTVASYASRYSELAGQLHLPAALIAGAAMAGNGALVTLSYLFANTLGLLVYPLTTVFAHADYLATQPGPVIVSVLVGAAGGGVAWLVSGPRAEAAGGATDSRFLMVLGTLWAGLAYVPFILSIGYPRNVGLLVDRINVLGSMGVVLCLGAGLGLLQAKVRRGAASWPAAYSLSVAALAVVLLLNLHLQKAHFVEGEQKERALVGAVLDAAERLRAGGREPVFLLDRSAKEAFPKAQLQQALSRPSGWDKVVQVGAFVLKRYFSGITASTTFHFSEIYFFSCCPASAPVTFNFYADWAGRPLPLVYKREEPFRLIEEADHFTIGYASTEAWNDPSYRGEFRTYAKQDHVLMVLHIGESTFRLGGPLTYSFKPYRGSGTGEGSTQREL